MMDEYERVFRLRNLYKAGKKISKGSMWKDGTAVYRSDNLKNSYKRRKELLNGTYKMQRYEEFHITRPKPRDITATRIHDRHPQRSLCDNYLYPRVTRSFIYDNGACQRSRGVDFQINRTKCALQRFYRQQRRKKAKELGCRVEDVPPFKPVGWIYKGDVRKYFPSTLHSNAKAIVRKYVDDERLRALLFCVIESFGRDWWKRLCIKAGASEKTADGFSRKVMDARMEREMLPIRPAESRAKILAKCEAQIRKACSIPGISAASAKELTKTALDRNAPVRGIGLGSQISQILQLSQLDGIDHAISEVIRPFSYQRYMDDDWALDESRIKVERIQSVNEQMLKTLGLELNAKSQVMPLSQGLVFLKWHFYLTDTGAVVMRAAPGVAKNEKRRLRRMAKRVRESGANPQSLRSHYEGWRAHMARGDTEELLASMDEYFNSIMDELDGGIENEHCGRLAAKNCPRGSNDQ